MSWSHTIELQLEIIPPNKILVPGCEPTSSLSSRTLSAYMAKFGCGSALVDVNVALAAIPGSYIKYASNFNRGSFRQKWFVLPAITPYCPCEPYPDYYQILKGLANGELPLEENYDRCDINGMGFCPSPDFNLAEPPPLDPYRTEGSFPAGGGVLPPLPAWQGGSYDGISSG